MIDKKEVLSIHKVLVEKYGKDIVATEEEKYEFVISVASGKLKYEGILSWITSKLKIK